ncbi:MAG: hypothetical protein V8S10_05020 [Clostridia bacterium]|jgi:hypothetical protein
MEKIKKYIPKIILLDTILYMLIIVTLYFILSSFKLMFREWIYIVSAVIIIGGFVAGIIQLLLKIKEKILRNVLIGIVIILLLLSTPAIFFLGAFSYMPEHIVRKDGKKYVAYVNGFLRTYVSYYDYKNIFVVGNQKRIEEDYGKGGFDPIENKFGNKYDVEMTTYYDEDGNVVSRENTKSDNQIQETEIENITNNIEETYNGIITNINFNSIVFENKSRNKKYSINVNSSLNFINRRTNEKVNYDDIKIGYYIDTYTYKKSKAISILSNIKGEELRKELIKNLTLEDSPYLTVSPIGTNIEIINSNKAILTITFEDLLPDYNVDGGKFEMKVEINSNTVIERKGGRNKIEQLKDADLCIIKIRLDKNTINNEIPIATYFMSSDGN